MYTITSLPNYATPSGSYNKIFNPTIVPNTYKYMQLMNNNLTGEYHPIADDVGFWGDTLSDAVGNITIEQPTILITGEDTLQTIRLVGDAPTNTYPTKFTITASKNSSVVYTKVVTNNTLITYEFNLPSTLEVDEVQIVIQAINRAYDVCKLINVYQPHKLVRNTDIVPVITTTSILSDKVQLHKQINLGVTLDNTTWIRNYGTRQTDLVVQPQFIGRPINAHTRTSDDIRDIRGKVYVTYSNPLADVQVESSSSGVAYNYQIDQLSNGKFNRADQKFFTLFDNNLEGNCLVSDLETEMGWSSTQLTNSSSIFTTDVFVQINFTARLLKGFQLVGDLSREVYLTDFTIRVTRDDSTFTEWTVNNHTSNRYEYTNTLIDVVSIRVTALKMNASGVPALITELTVNSTVLYQDADLMSIDLLEELTYDDTIGTLGCVSANTVTVVFSNETQSFYFNNEQSAVAKQLKRNRRIVPWLGTTLGDPNVIEWYCLGTFWSYRWDVPVDKMTATVTAFDSIGLLNTITFFDHLVYFNYSIAQALELVFAKARVYFPELQYTIDPALTDIIIPVLWFTKTSFMQALKRLASCALIDIYCARDGTIMCIPRRMEATFTVADWSDATNIKSKSYPTLYTEVPNRISVGVTTVVQATQEVLNYTTVFTIAGAFSQEFIFSYPTVGTLSITIDKDATVSYTYQWYSWGIIFSFTGTGDVRSIVISATALTISSTSTVVKQNAELIILNGENPCSITSDLIQTTARATAIAEDILTVANEEIYVTDIVYRGDITITLNDAIRMGGGIAPTNKYLLTRHTLAWDGSLAGTARLGT